MHPISRSNGGGAAAKVLRSIGATALFAASIFGQAPPPIPSPALAAVSEIPRQRAVALRAHYDELVRTSAAIAERAEAAGSLGQIYFALSHFEAVHAAFSTAAFLAPDDFRWSYYPESAVRLRMPALHRDPSLPAVVRRRQ